MMHSCTQIVMDQLYCIWNEDVRELWTICQTKHEEPILDHIRNFSVDAHDQDNEDHKNPVVDPYYLSLYEYNSKMHFGHQVDRDPTTLVFAGFNTKTQVLLSCNVEISSSVALVHSILLKAIFRVLRVELGLVGRGKQGWMCLKGVIHWHGNDCFEVVLLWTLGGCECLD